MTQNQTGIQFLKVNGTVPNGRRLEILVDGKVIDSLTIQLSWNPPTYFRVIGSGILEKDKIYRIRKSEPEESVLEQIRQEARRKYCPGIRGFFSGRRINVRYSN